MRIPDRITINGKPVPRGSSNPGLMIYGFFLVHMLAFGASGFFMAYTESGPPVSFLYMHGGFAIFVYTIFYLSFFGLDEVKWMFINSALGIFGIYSQIDLILSFFNKKVGDFPWYVHVIPFLYFILYTFLIRQMVLDLTNSRNNETRKKFVEYGYILVTVAIYLII